MNNTIKVFKCLYNCRQIKWIIYKTIFIFLMFIKFVTHKYEINNITEYYNVIGWIIELKNSPNGKTQSS